jgi:hypothetical protein
MVRRLLIGTGLIGFGALAATLWSGSSSPGPVAPGRGPAASARLQRFDVPAPVGLARVSGDDLAARVEQLTAQLAAESAERRRLAEQLEAVIAQLAQAEHGSLDGAAADPLGEEKQLAAADGNAVIVPTAAPVDDSLSPMERALVAAGIDADQAADMKRRRDALTMQEITLRDQATREQWIDTPRFAEALDQIQAQQVSVRDEIGDFAYDRYLVAEGRTNRVRVDDVLSESPAAAVGLQPGDYILSYADTRLFAPDDLVAETRSGTAGDTVRLRVNRAGQRFEVEVPRGPLGLRVNAAQDVPDEG